MKKFNIPTRYRSSIISEIKEIKKTTDRRKLDFSPIKLDFGPLKVYTARHFGFCYGVENAIEKAYNLLEEYPNKKIYLLSEMIHNPMVNEDLQNMGISFIQDTQGNNLISWDIIQEEDIVIIPAFDTTLSIEKLLREKGIAIEKYDTTCPFVGRVWKRSKDLGQKDYTVIIHGKIDHEETRATFSRASDAGHAVIIQNMEEAQLLVDVINSESMDETFEFYFGNSKNRTEGFIASEHLKRIGVVNQTTMLATETTAIADYIKRALIKKYPEWELKDFFADTNDTLCYATSDNQKSLYSLIETEADVAIVVGGSKSANTTHLVELCEDKLATFFISSEKKILSKNQIISFNRHTGKEEVKKFLPEKKEINILLTSGASCPDAIVEEVIKKVLSFFDISKSLEEVLVDFKKENLST